MPKNSLRVAPYGVNRYTGATCLVDSLPRHQPGEILSYGAYPTIVWEDNAPFYATMEFIAKPALFRVRDVYTGREYSMFPSDVNDYILDDLVSMHLITGLWRAVKKNTSYGIALVR